MPDKTEHPGLDCLFCKTKDQERAFCETENFKAIYNIAPILPGHSLILPKNHIQSIFELTEKELFEMFQLARRVTTGLKTYFNCDGSDWTIQDGESAGQTIQHLHLHIIPRFPFDLPGENEWYDFIIENEKDLKDSNSRKKLDTNEYNFITDQLYKSFEENNEFI